MGPALRFPSIVGGPSHGGRFFFVDDPEYFDREQLYSRGAADYPDNAERFAELSRAAIEFAKQIWMPDVIHCHDWQSVPAPVLLGTLYKNDPQLRPVPVIFTIHNMGYQGLFPRDTLARLGLPASLFRTEGLEFYGKINCLKGGLLYADYLTTVSRKYAEEIQTPEYGAGLDGVLRQRAESLVGILTGVDYTEWNPSSDKLIAANYTAKQLEGKRACKRDLLAEFGLPAAGIDRPVVGIVSRFVDQKGFDLLAEAADELLEEDLAIVALGTGVPKYEKMFLALAQRYPARVAVKVAYNNVLAHKIEAGADLFLMPSRYEPCGLNQIYSLKYGTVPVVRATGGLDDTIENFDLATGRGTGFKFGEYTAAALLGAVRGGSGGVPAEDYLAPPDGQWNGQGFFLADSGGRVCQAVRSGAKGKNPLRLGVI